MGPVTEWVEATGSTVDIAVQAALQELGLESRDQALVEVIREGKPGILGSSWRAEDAVVKVMAKPPERTQRRRRGRGGGKNKRSEGGDERRNGRGAAEQGDPDRRQRGAGGGGERRERPREGDRRGAAKPERERSERGQRTGGKPRSGGSGSRNGGNAAREEEASIEEQAKVASDFVRGLLGAFGLEGEVTTTIDDDILKIDVTGDQTEALVGRKGAIMQAVLEITRTVVQRKTFGAPRLRIDINGYAERRREALTIYAGRQAERILEEGGEVMLEPMNAADRKVVHDAVAGIDGVRSYSEGEDPDRAVVISKDDTSDD